MTSQPATNFDKGCVYYLFMGVRVVRGKKLEFYPSNPGSTPFRIKTSKKDQKPPSVP